MDQTKVAPPGRITPRRLAILLAIPTCATIGNTLLSIGMKHAGNINLHNWFALIRAITDPHVAVGILLLIGFMIAQLTALSWADLTFVIPVTSIGYIAIPLISDFYLHEKLSYERWAGVGLIFIGIVSVAGGPSRTKKPAEGSA